MRTFLTFVPKARLTYLDQSSKKGAMSLVSVPAPLWKLICPPVVPALGPAPEALTTTIVPFLEPVGIPITIDRVIEAPKAPISVKARTNPISPAAQFPLFRPKSSYYRKSPRRGSPTDEGASRGSHYRPSPHRDTPMDRGVQNSSYYRPSYSVRNARVFSESKDRALSLASTYSLGESLDDEETLTTESWTKPSSHKQGEFMVPAYKSPEPPSTIEESWAEIASRKHKELMAIKAANITTSKHISLATSEGESKPLKQIITLEQSASVEKDTPVSPVRDVRLLLFKRKRQSKAEGLDIQHQISSLLYPRKRKARQTPPTESKMNVSTDVEKDVDFAKVFESSAQRSSTRQLPIPLQEMNSQSEALLSASDQGIHPERQGFLNNSPMLIPPSQRSSISSKSLRMHPERQFLLQTSPSPNESPEHLHLQAESRPTISPSKIKIDTQTLQSKIQELRRASSADEKPRPIPSIMNELSFSDDPFESDQYAVEPVIPTHWQD
ncbi:uncharacterized protein Bfra_003553 [Botrytis fragariae]|uniref:Uncharacterized protein n=1 Tax=Botrytis fragariae TaxID=1964551 RepID=A0A8H6EKE0_9HELO|nr:uncharacterized protein Bfra_003553 [Botrytis fragariae]KAF5875100.1 hypothetical protein Bfra_003553 [Botrytis fragariae]